MLDLVIVGAGHAGLAASQRATVAGLEHVVLERGAIGESWRSQRWDSFTLNTHNAMTGLPGSPYAGDAPEAFTARDPWVARLERYARDQALPIRTGAHVRVVERDADGFRIGTATEQIRTRSVIVASGTTGAGRIPAEATALDPRIVRVTTAAYRNPAELPPGGVLVVGSAQSGAQIAEDLVAAGREVYLATGTVGRVPRRVRGRDMLSWLTETGWGEQRPADLPDPAMQRAAQPLTSGTGALGHTLSLQSLAAHGVTLLGRFTGADGARVRFAADLPQHIAFGDEISRRMRQHVDDHIARAGIAAPPSDPDPADAPVPDPERFTAPTELDLFDRGIRTAIFSTGFSPDLSWLHLPVFDERGTPLHRGGRSPVDGLWFLGLIWLRKRKSGVIWGADEDSAEIVAEVAAYLRA